MVKPDSVLLGETRTEKARASDEFQMQLANQRQRVFGISFCAVVLIEIGLWYWGIDVWVRLVVPILWVGFLVHNNALLVLHELWEINDQLAGRKDDFRGLLKEKGDNDQGSNLK
jgi:hypothetical protein